MIDWKGNVKEDDQNELSYHEIYQFFESIFQSKKTSESPVLAEIQDEIGNYDISIPISDMNIRIDEINLACKNMGNGTGIDGLPPIIAKILPQSIKDIIQHLFQTIFDGEYPEQWEQQLLFPIKKKDHSVSNPKLRGIGIGQMLSRLYDDVINQRFCSWFTPNMEQAATAGQGCVCQIFALLLLIDYAKISRKSLFIGLLDFEKAYDFTNRAILIQDMMKKGAGKKLVQAINCMYSSTSYTPKIDKNSIGDPIVTSYGVTQGRKSSSNLFAFAISEMPESVRNIIPKDFMDPFCMAQLADDTSISAESLVSMTNKFHHVIKYSDIKHQHINTSKTKYMHMSTNPIQLPVILENEKVIKAVELDTRYPFLGFNLTYSDDIYDLIVNNLNSKMFNVAKFHAWLEYNDETPFFIKIKVLYACFFSSLLYSAEAWGNLEKIEKTLITTELKALKSCLGIKSGTTSDLIYIEINRPDIIAVIKDRQFNFVKKIQRMKKGESLVKEIWDLCSSESPSLKYYYENMNNKNAENNIATRINRVETSDQSMCIRYKTIIGMHYSNILYESCLDDTKRTTITRWRMSSHNLKIETGRYTRPITARENRLCDVCKVIDDEYHAIYVCSIHRLIREKYKNILKLEDRNLHRLLNPTSTTEANYLGKFLNEIDKNVKEFQKS